MSDSEAIDKAKPEVAEVKKQKDPRRVAAGKKGAEARKRNAELRRKETDTIKKENMELKSITRDDDVQTNKKSITRDDDVQTNNSQKNYIPLCITVGVIGIGLYMYKSKQVAQPTSMMQQPVRIIQQKEIDPFDFN